LRFATAALFLADCTALFLTSDAACLAERAAAYPDTAADAAFCLTLPTADLILSLTLEATCLATAERSSPLPLLD